MKYILYIKNIYLLLLNMHITSLCTILQVCFHFVAFQNNYFKVAFMLSQ